MNVSGNYCPIPKVRGNDRPGFALTGKEQMDIMGFEPVSVESIEKQADVFAAIEAPGICRKESVLWNAVKEPQPGPVVVVWREAIFVDATIEFPDPAGWDCGFSLRPMVRRRNKGDCGPFLMPGKFPL